jgi:hypothetical protein
MTSPGFRAVSHITFRNVRYDQSATLGLSDLCLFQAPKRRKHHVNTPPCWPWRYLERRFYSCYCTRMFAKAVNVSPRRGVLAR